MLQTAQEHNATQTDLAFQRCINPACGATYEARSVRTACDKCGDLLDIALRLGPRRGAQKAERIRGDVERANQSGPFQRRVAVSRIAAVCLPRSADHGRRRPDIAAANRSRGRLRRDESWATAPAIRGDESLGQLQRQRHVCRGDPRQFDGGQASCLCQHRQHQCFAGALLQRDATDEGDHLHRQRKDLLRQAQPGTRLRCVDGSDRR